MQPKLLHLPHLFVNYISMLISLINTIIQVFIDLYFEDMLMVDEESEIKGKLALLNSHV